MATQDAGELAELRRRAYGPDADIDADADARRPLQELEAELREPVSAPAAPSEDAWPDELSSLLDDPPPEVAAPSAVAPSSPTPTRPRRRGVWALAGAVVIVAISGISFWLGGSVGQPQPDRVFNENLRELPSGISRLPLDEAMVEDYGIDTSDERWQGRFAGGFDIWTTTTLDGNRCLTISEESSDGSGEEFRTVWGVSCAHTWDPMVELPGDSFSSANYPEFADVQTLRFVWRSDGVALFLDPRAPAQAGTGGSDVDVLTGFER